jgi:peroxiredoxin
MRHLLIAIVFLVAASALGAEPEPINLRVPAPELAGISDWVNSDPLTLAQLKGRVVVLHFFTRGCINCIRNYPHMKSWHADFKGKNVTVLGIHTPEFDAEKNLERIKAKAKENGLLFPIAVDNDAKTWRAWSNRWWPCVYLIDKSGVVRYRWDGELNWRDVMAEPVMRKKIEALLAESP